MTSSGRRGMRLFYGRASCSSCHSGVFQTDHDFHAVGMPQIGPGKGDDLPGFDDGLDDFGRERVTGMEADRQVTSLGKIEGLPSAGTSSGEHDTS